MKRNILALLLLYIIMFIGSCDTTNEPDCNCDGIGITEIEFVGMQTEVIEDADTTDGEFAQYEDIVAIEDFLLRVSLPSNRTSFNSRSSRVSAGFGFEKAYACTCVLRETVLFKVEKIQVFQKEVEGSDYVDVSSAFGVLDFFNYNNEVFSIAEALQASRTAEDNLWVVSQYDLRILNPEEILEEAIFKVVITLSNNQVFEQETSVILFSQS